LVAHHFLNRSATDLTVTDRQPPLGKRSLAETLAHRVALACMRCPMRKKGRVSSDLNRTAAYRFVHARFGQAAGPGLAWLSPAAPAQLFFFRKLFCLFVRYFYFLAPGSLVVLSFLQPLNFSSVFPSL
jgi:hypothetical protein